MNARRMIPGLCALMLLALLGCQSNTKPVEQKAGVVYLDPNAPQAEAAQAPAAEEKAAPAAATAAPAAAETAPAAAPAAAPAEAAELPDLYFEGKGVRLEPGMEAAPALSALGDPIGAFEADSCAYVGKDLFYYYPGFELTVNEVEGVDRITAITVADDTVTTPQGLRIFDEEEKLLSTLGGTSDKGVYTYQKGTTVLIVQVKETEGGVWRIASMEYRTAVDQ